MQGDLGLPEYIETCEEVKAACNFEALNDKCLGNAILLGLRNQWVYEKCIEGENKLVSADVIYIATEAYTSDRLLSIMQNLSATTAAATVVRTLV